MARDREMGCFSRRYWALLAFYVLCEILSNTKMIPRLREAMNLCPFSSIFVCNLQLLVLEFFIHYLAWLYPLKTSFNLKYPFLAWRPKSSVIQLQFFSNPFTNQMLCPSVMELDQLCPSISYIVCHTPDYGMTLELLSLFPLRHSKFFTAKKVHNSSL